MNALETSINIGLGDNLSARLLFENLKTKYDAIRVSHNQRVIEIYRNNDHNYCRFLDELGELLFNCPPFHFSKQDYVHYPEVDFYNLVNNEQNAMLNKPDLDYLCEGQPLALDQEYIVITTKIRILSKMVLTPMLPAFFEVINQLGSRYKIVILGERVVEESMEYRDHSDNIYEIYKPIIENVKSEYIHDLSIPALGITAPNIKQLRQDLLIMKNAKCVITFGLGGNVWMGASVAQLVGFRIDDHFPATQLTDMLQNSQHSSLFLTKDWVKFLDKLKSYQS